MLERGITIPVYQLNSLIKEAKEADFVCSECGAVSAAPEECDECHGSGETGCECAKCDDQHYVECDACDAYGYINLHCACGKKKHAIPLRIGPAIVDTETLDKALASAHDKDRAFIGWDVDGGKLVGVLIVGGNSKRLQAKVAQ